MFGFHVNEDHERPKNEMGFVQASFGSRSMFRLNIEKKLAVEEGLSLVYSQGPTGEVAVMLFPFKSNLARVRETFILLRVDWFTAHQLQKAVSSDVAALIAYGYVTSLDAEAALREKVRVFFLRKTRPVEVDGESTGPKNATAYAIVFLKALPQSILLSVLRPAAIVIVSAVLVALGYSYLADYLRPH